MGVLVGGLFLISLAVLFWPKEGLLTPARSRVTIVNAGSVAMVSGRLWFAHGKGWNLPRLEPDGSVGFDFVQRSDDHYVLIATWVDGKALRDSFGYVTGGLDIRDTISISQSGVELNGRAVTDEIRPGKSSP
jgi:hypothetical protein